jgi:hypothetical protein
MMGQNAQLPLHTGGHDHIDVVLEDDALGGHNLAAYPSHIAPQFLLLDKGFVRL